MSEANTCTIKRVTEQGSCQLVARRVAKVDVHMIRKEHLKIAWAKTAFGAQACFSYPVLPVKGLGQDACIRLPSLPHHFCTCMHYAWQEGRRTQWQETTFGTQ